MRRALAGDLVLLAPRDSGSSGEQDGGEPQPESGGAAAAGAVGAGSMGLAAAGLSSSAARLAAVHVVTAEEAAAGRWSLSDVVLPLPGPAVLYPQHGTGQLYQQLAGADGVDLSAVSHGVKEFSWEHIGGGDYRPVVVVPENVSAALLDYEGQEDVPEVRGGGVEGEGRTLNLGQRRWCLQSACLSAYDGCQGG